MSVTESVTQQLSPTTDVSTAVVMAVADATDMSPEDLPPLYDIIDPDALDAMFQPCVGGQQHTSIHVTFTLAGCTVSIQDSDVTVTLNSETVSEQPAPQLAQKNNPR